jgi:hypothetical protein
MRSVFCVINEGQTNDELSTLRGTARRQKTRRPGEHKKTRTKKEARRETRSNNPTEAE